MAIIEKYCKKPWPVAQARYASLAAAAVLLLSVCAPTHAAQPDTGAALDRVLAGEQRSAENRARDKYRHPRETLLFFGLRPDMAVGELWPGGGWYTEIIAPLVAERGKYYAAQLRPDPDNKYVTSALKTYREKLQSRPDLYGKVAVTAVGIGGGEIAPPGTLDLVVTFRNVHNWVWDGAEKDVLAAAFRALKPGGVLGVVEHRHNDPNFKPEKRGQAYVGEEYAVRLVESVGFKLAGRSNINDNPKDTKDYPKGVWTLPPSYAEGDKDREKYAAIGESDRFTLKFMKPRS